MTNKKEVSEKSNVENPMRKIKIEKVILSAGGKDKELEKSVKLISILSGMKAQIIATTKRIPDFDISPGHEVGTRVTLRGEPAIKLLARLLASHDNMIHKRKVAENQLSFGIKEYIEIPGIEYQRDIGVKGLNVAVVFTRAGVRVKRKKIKSGTLPRKQYVSKNEIIKFMEERFKTQFT